MASSPSDAPTLGSSEPNAMIGIAMTRGDEAFARGDVISARQFYELAASIGFAHAATAVGSTYDPDFLTARDVRGKFTDTKAAKQWYLKGIAGGDAEARLRLDKLLEVAKDSR
jgi:TPR repeat protein